MRFGYVRVSSQDQNTERQEAALKPHCDEILIEMKSGKDIKRNVLESLLARLRAGDELVVKSIDRLARNTKDLLTLMDELVGRGVTVRFLDNAMSFDNSPTSRFVLTMMGAVAELERGFINQRQREGIAIAKEKGVYQGKPKNAELRKTLAKLFARGMSAEEAAKVAKCGRATAFRIKKELSEASSGK